MLYGVVKNLRDSGIPNDEIYMQIWGHANNNPDLVWQTVQAKSMGVENVFNYYFRGWIPPAYPVPIDYSAL
jgi:hypothetical protein